MLPIIRTRTWLIIGILIALLAALGGYLFVTQAKTGAPQDAAVPAAAPLPAEIEIADTPAARTLGLSGRTSIADDYGLLFVFETDGRFGFWMKDMQFPIDITWIAADGRIVHLEQNVSPDTYPDIFTPERLARYVLETRAGYAAEHGWAVGTLLNLSAYRQ